MSERRRPNPSRVLLAALAVGLAAAALPVLATHDRPCASPATPPSGAPAYLVLTRDPRIEELRCAAHGRLAFIQVGSAVEVDAHLAFDEVAGVILDRETYVRLRAGQLSEWLTVGTGRAVIGFGLTAAQLSADPGGPAQPDPALPSTYVGGSHVGHLSFLGSPRGTCGGGGTIPYRGSQAARALVDRLLEWALRDCGIS